MKINRHSSDTVSNNIEHHNAPGKVSTYHPNLFNRIILKIGRTATNPISITIILISYGYWLFNHGASDTKYDIIISASIEFTKGFFAFLAIFGSYRLFKIERLFGWRIISAACIWNCHNQIEQTRFTGIFCRLVLSCDNTISNNWCF